MRAIYIPCLLALVGLVHSSRHEKPTDEASIKRLLNLVNELLDGNNMKSEVRSLERRNHIPSNCMQEDNEELERLLEIAANNTDLDIEEVDAQMLVNTVITAVSDWLNHGGVPAEAHLCVYTIHSVAMSLNIIQEHIIPNITQRIVGRLATLNLDNQIPDPAMKEVLKNLPFIMKSVFLPVMEIIRSIVEEMGTNFAPGMDIELIKDKFHGVEIDEMMPRIRHPIPDFIRRTMGVARTIAIQLYHSIGSSLESNTCDNKLQGLLSMMQSKITGLQGKIQHFKTCLEQTTCLDGRIRDTIADSVDTMGVIRRPFDVLDKLVTNLQSARQAAINSQNAINPDSLEVPRKMLRFVLAREIAKLKFDAHIHRIKVIMGLVDLDDVPLSEMDVYTIPTRMMDIWDRVTEQSGLPVTREPYNCTTLDMVFATGVVRSFLKNILKPSVLAGIATDILYTLPTLITPDAERDLVPEIRLVLKNMLDNVASSTTSEIEKISSLLQGTPGRTQPIETLHYRLGLISEESRGLKKAGDVVDKMLRIILPVLGRLSQENVTVLDSNTLQNVQQLFNETMNSLNRQDLIQRATSRIVALLPRGCVDDVVVLNIETILHNRLTEITYQFPFELTIDEPQFCFAKDSIRNNLFTVMLKQLQLLHARIYFEEMQAW